MAADLSPLLVILGPTGTGKSQLALALAKRFGAEIVNFDSIQVYRRLDIGSAKVPPAERGSIPHHLIDVVDIDQELTAGAYSRLAREAILTVQRNQRLPILVGGTGFYLRALLDGLSPAPERNERLRARLSHVLARRPGALHRFLRRYDPAAAKRIHPNDRQKLIRAVELSLLTRQTVSKVQSLPRNSLQGAAILKFGLAPQKPLLHKHLNERSAWMFRNGLLAETQTILDAGFSPSSKPLQALGYRQAVGVITGSLPLEDAIRECQTKTRQYAKRQMTWFRKERGIEWLRGFGHEESIQVRAGERADAFLTSPNRRNRIPSFD